MAFGFGKKAVTKDYTERVNRMHVTCPSCKQTFDGETALDNLYICLNLYTFTIQTSSEALHRYNVLSLNV